MIKALILDLDDTIFPTSSIDPQLVKPFFDSLERNNDVLSDVALRNAMADLWRRPFHVVAKAYGFSQHMIDQSLETLNSLEFSFDIHPYEDYTYLKALPLTKFLVTTGMTKLQEAKIQALGLENDFEEILIDDPMLRAGGKEKAFSNIMQKYSYQPHELLVIGDNPDSEIRAAIALGIPARLIDRNPDIDPSEHCMRSFQELVTSLYYTQQNDL